jgi:hypothetical protein
LSAGTGPIGDECRKAVVPPRARDVCGDVRHRRQGYGYQPPARSTDRPARLALAGAASHGHQPLADQFTAVPPLGSASDDPVVVDLDSLDEPDGAPAACASTAPRVPADRPVPVPAVRVHGGRHHQYMPGETFFRLTVLGEVRRLGLPVLDTVRGGQPGTPQRHPVRLPSKRTRFLGCTMLVFVLTGAVNTHIVNHHTLSESFAAPNAPRRHRCTRAGQLARRLARSPANPALTAQHWFAPAVARRDRYALPAAASACRVHPCTRRCWRRPTTPARPPASCGRRSRTISSINDPAITIGSDTADGRRVRHNAPRVSQRASSGSRSATAQATGGHQPMRERTGPWREPRR